MFVDIYLENGIEKLQTNNSIFFRLADMVILRDNFIIIKDLRMQMFQNTNARVRGGLDVQNSDFSRQKDFYRISMETLHDMSKMELSNLE